MKSGSDNFRSSAIQGIIERLEKKSIKVVIYEPLLEEDLFNGIEIIKDFNQFKSISDTIVANRVDEILEDVKQKVYTRDIFHSDR